MFFTKLRNRAKSLRAQRVRSPHFGVEALEPRRLFSSLVVTTIDDSTSHPGFVSLRDAMFTANTDAANGTSDTITFDPSLDGDTITLQQGVLSLGADGTVSGVISIDGGNQITISGNGASSVFQVDQGITLSISGLAITDGVGSSGGEGDCGGIYNDGTLTVSNSTLSANTATTDADGDGDGGGIDNESTLTVVNSTFSDNTSQLGGGIYNDGTLTVANSTFSGDTAGEGGGIYNDTGMTVTNSTLSGNSAADYGGGIFNEGTLTLLNTIVAGNTADAEADGPDIDSALTSNSTYNLIGDGSGMTGITNGFNGNQVGTSAAPIGPGLLQLDDNGGPTQTMALTANSPARHAGGSLTKLTGAVTSSATTIPVALASAIASTPGSYLIQVESEQMLVTNVSGNNLIVTRGYNGTTEAAHAANAKVYLPTDQTGSPRLGIPDIGAFQYQLVTSSVNPLPATETSATFDVSWSGTPGTDDYGVANYSIYVSDNGGQYTPWQDQTTDTSDPFTGVNGHTYRFYSIATDTAGNVQPTPTAPQASTRLQVPPVFTSANHTTFTVGTAGSFTVAASGTPVPAYNETGTLPSGISLNSTTGVLSGTSAAGSVGTYPLTLTASNGVGAPATQSFTLTIAAASTKTALTKSTTSAIKYGQSVTFTAAVAPSSTDSLTPSGTVTFEDGSTVLGTATLSGGVAKFTSTTIPAGSNSIKAVYGADSNFTASTSGSLTQTVNQSATTTALTKSTTTTAKFGQSITFTATMAAVSPGAGTPTGTVTFEDGSTVIGTATLSGGVARFATTALAVGSHSIKAVYGGDTNFSSSSSGSMTQTVAQASTTTKLTKNTSGPITSGTSVTFTATVAAVSPGAGLPANGETVTFIDNGSSIGTETLSAGVATLITTTLPVGSNSITAVYSGDTDYTTSTSSALSQTVNA